MRPVAIFTIAQNEPHFLPIWLGYYSQFFDAKDMYVLNHNHSGYALEELRRLRSKHRFHQIDVHRDISFNQNWILQTVSKFRDFLLQSYSVVVYAESDEILAARPDGKYANLRAALLDARGKSKPFLRTMGYDIVHKVDEEPPIDFAQPPLLRQRNYWCFSPLYCKPTVVTAPVRWSAGFHNCIELREVERALRAGGLNPLASTCTFDLLLLHLHRIDFANSKTAHRRAAALRWEKRIGPTSHAWVTRQVSDEALRRTFMVDLGTMRSVSLHVIPENYREIV